MALTLKQVKRRDTLIKYYKRIVCKSLGMSEFSCIKEIEGEFVIIDKGRRFRCNVQKYKPRTKEGNGDTTTLTPLFKHLLKGASVLNIMSLILVNKEFYKTVFGEGYSIDTVVYPHNLDSLYKWYGYKIMYITSQYILCDLLCM